jgi:hypothetical protein
MSSFSATVSPNRCVLANTGGVAIAIGCCQNSASSIRAATRQFQARARNTPCQAGCGSSSGGSAFRRSAPCGCAVGGNAALCRSSGGSSGGSGSGSGSSGSGSGSASGGNSGPVIF